MLYKVRMQQLADNIGRDFDLLAQGLKTRAENMDKKERRLNHGRII